MSPWLWWPLLVAASAATTNAISYYLHWSWRYEKRRYGIVAEISFLVFLASLGATAVGALIAHWPH